MNKAIKYLVLGWIGGAVYVIMEMAFRIIPYIPS